MIATASLFANFDFKGDTRLRYESIERTDKDNKYRERYRFRLFTNYTYNQIKIETGIISGKDNPTSGNVTFKDDEAISDYFMDELELKIIDLDYTSDFGTFKIGKSKYMLYRPIESQLVWDNDLIFQGVNFSNGSLTLGANQNNKVIPGNDINFFVGQYITEYNDFTMGTGLTWYTGVKGNTPAYESGFLGNSNQDGIYVNDYHIIDGFIEYKISNNWKTAFAIAYNTAVNKDNFGYDFGVEYSWNDLKVKYSYTDIQADAVFGAHSDSDNFGGGSGSKGHAIRTKYAVNKNLDLASSFFYNTLYNEADYERVQLDCIIKF